MKNLLLFFVFLSFSSCCSQSVISKTNREISKNYIKYYNNEIAKKSEKKSFLIRKELIAQGKLRFLIDTDELFILSATDFEEGINIKLIWNKQDEICYSQNRDGFELIDNPFNLDLLPRCRKIASRGNTPASLPRTTRYNCSGTGLIVG